MFFNKYAFHLFSITLFLMVLAMAWVQIPNRQLKTNKAPSGLQSLQKTFDSIHAKDIVDSWSDKTQCATQSLRRDFALIFAYSAFLFIVVFRQRAHLPKWTRYALIAIGVAALCDCAENILTLLYLHGSAISIRIITMLSWIKFGLLVVIALYSLVTRRVAIVSLLNALYLYAAGIIAVVLIYFLLIELTQGQDVLMQVAEWSGPRWATTFCLLVSIILFWYTSRILGYAKRVNNPGVIQIRLEEHLPRIVAVNVLIALQAAVFALPTIAGLDELEVWAFVVAQNVLYFILHQMLTQKLHRVLNLILLLVALGWYVGFAIPEVRPQDPVHMRWLPYYSLFIFAFQVVLVYIFVFRHKKIAKAIAGGNQYLKIFNFKAVQVPPGVANAEQFYFNLLNIFATLGLLAYVVPFFSLYVSDTMGPLAYALLALGILVGLSNLLTYLTIRTGANFFFLLLLWAVVIGLFHDHYGVRLKRLESKRRDPRSGLSKYLENWVKHPERREKILDADPGTFVTYIVIADGGASRSGYWVARVLAALQDTTINWQSDPKSEKDIFSQHLLCLAGASGGSVGNATFYTLLRNLDNNEAVFKVKAAKLLRQDFLSPVLTRWLGTDIFAHVVPHPLEDRAGILERAIERFARDSMELRIDSPFEEQIDFSGRLPMLFINTTYMQEGVPAVVSSIKLDEFTNRVDVVAEVNKLGFEMNYSTAVILGARFPYVSPAGRIGKKYYVDGGYFDNTGAGIVHEMLIELDSIKNAEQMIRSDYFKEYLSKLKFRLLYLSNYSKQRSDTAEVHSLTNDFLAPVLTVLGTYSSQTEVNNERLVKYLRLMSPRGDTVEVNLYSEDQKEDFPMNWVISEYHLNRMDVRLDQVRREEFKNVLSKK